MTNRFKRFAAISAVGLGLGLGAASPSQATGIPTVDIAGNIMQAINHIEDISQYIQQYNQLVQQYQQMVQTYQMVEQTYNAMSGARGLEMLLNNPLVRQLVPSDMMSTLNNAVSLQQCAATLSSGALAKCRMQGSQSAISSIQQSIGGSIKNRELEIQSLINRLSTSVDDKEVQDLQVRLGGETANAVTELANMLNAQEQMRNQQRKTELDTARETSERITDSILNGANDTSVSFFLD